MNKRDEVQNAYRKGFHAGKKSANPERTFENGVDWRILGVNCDCGQQIIPCADDFGEGSKYWETRQEFHGKECDSCGKRYTFVTEEGNMASKRAKGL